MPPKIRPGWKWFSTSRNAPLRPARARCFTMPTWCWAAAGSSRSPCLPEGNLEFLLFSSLEGFQSTCVFFEQRAQSRQIGLSAAQEVDLTRRQLVHPRELGPFEKIGDGLGGIHDPL